MGLKRRDDFRSDAVRIALTSGLSRKQVASDLVIGLSTLNKCITAHRDTEVVSDKDLDLARQNEQLRRVSRILKEEREIPKRQRSSSRARAMRFRFIEEHRDTLCTKRMCNVQDVSGRGLRPYRS